MSISYIQTLTTDIVVGEIEVLLEWYNDVLRASFYPGAASVLPQAAVPGVLLDWAKREAGHGALDKASADRMGLISAELAKSSSVMLKSAAALAAPAQEVFEVFEHQFEAYVLQIRRLQQDVAEGSLAVDPVTGLRTAAGMNADIKREQDRFDRKNTPFSIACIGLDHVDTLSAKYDRRAMDKIYAAVAGLVQRTIRSFDDAYFTGRGEYIVVVKHLDFLDACAVMDRLRHDISAAVVALDADVKLKVTASFGIAEAQHKQAHTVALDNAKAALGEARETGGNRVVEFHEVSALAQYARDLNKK